ncbi:MAG: hypothetical protein WBA58_14090 [Giesbergeria sp.]|jgi:hypothetical protein
MPLPLQRRRFMVRLAAPAALLALSACATGPSPTTGQASLQQRAQAYWELVRVNDSVAAWAYEAASKDQSMTLEAYLKRGGIVYDAVEVRGIRSEDGDNAVLDVWMRYNIPMLRLKAQETVAQDHWRRIDGVWHHVLRRSAAFSDAKP